MVNHNRFYTYAYLRKDRTPYYIGKGNGYRIYDKDKREFKPPKDKSRIIFLKQNLTEEEAFKHEIYMIAVFGRKDLGTGILRNRTDGGEGPSGAIRSEGWKLNQSKNRKGKNNPNYGKLFSEKHRKKMSEAKIGSNNPNYGKKGKNHPTYGSSHSKGLKWWNDGNGNNKRSKECPGEGWVLGRSKIKS